MFLEYAKAMAEKVHTNAGRRIRGYADARTDTRIHVGKNTYARKRRITHTHTPIKTHTNEKKHAHTNIHIHASRKAHTQMKNTHTNAKKYTHTYTHT